MLLLDIRYARTAHLKSGEALLFLTQEYQSFENGYRNVQATAEFVVKVDKTLKEKGITLVFYIVPDKYDAYYELLQDKYKQREDHDFIGNVTSEVSNKGVITFNLFIGVSGNDQ